MIDQTKVATKIVRDAMMLTIAAAFPEGTAPYLEEFELILGDALVKLEKQLQEVWQDGFNCGANNASTQ